MAITQPIGSDVEWGKHSQNTSPSERVVRGIARKKNTCIPIRYAATLAEFSHFLRYRAATDLLPSQRKIRVEAPEQK